MRTCDERSQHLKDLIKYFRTPSCLAPPSPPDATAELAHLRALLSRRASHVTSRHVYLPALPRSVTSGPTGAAPAPPLPMGAPAKAGTEAVLRWEDLQRILRTGALDELERTHAMQKQYSEFSKRLKEEWVSVGDALLHRLFCWPSARCPERGKLMASAPSALQPQLLWAVNDFPYALSEGIQHHCVWSSAGEVAPQELQAFVLQHRPSHTWQSIVFCNPVHLQSVRNVWHAHVMSRPLQCDI